MRAEITPGEGGTRSTAEIIQDILDSIGEIVRSELRLARTEMMQKAGRAMRGAALLGAGGALLAVAGLLLVATITAALAIVLPVWVACLIMFILLGAAGGFMLAVGRDRLRRVDPKPITTINSVKEDVRWLKRSIK